MMILALIMCGGKGRRMEKFDDIEKPLLTLKGTTMIERVISALVESRKFSKIGCVTSSNTPKVKSFIRCYFPWLDVIETEGISYSTDLSMVLNKIKPTTVFVVPADLPLLNSKIVQKVIRKYRIGVPCLSIISDKQFVIDMGIKPSLVLNFESGEYCHTGITIIDSSKIRESYTLKEYYSKMNEKEIVVNVNTREELGIAKRFLG